VHEVLERIDELAESFGDRADEADQLGRLPDVTAKELKDTGIIRMLQPRDYGGYEAHPAEFLEAIMKVGAKSGSAGWVSGVVGVHPWQLAQVDRRIQEQIWGNDPDTWVASPYAPLGRARRVDGGYVFTGRWGFSSGTDHCSWIILGGMVTDDEGVPLSPPQVRNFILPRQDYEIIADSWNVMGLKGTGSKDVEVHGAFVPEHQCVNPADFQNGISARSVGREEALYGLPFMTVFPGTIVASTIGIAEGALAAFIEYSRGRFSFASGKAVKTDPHQLKALGAAAADIRASRIQVLDDIKRMYDTVDAGGTVSMEDRYAARSGQVRASRRAVDAIDDLFILAGGGSLRTDNPLQRFWRDLHAAMNHFSNVAEPIHEAYGLNVFGLPVPPTVLV
jgi:3-hydroxy-9,10-secoandrosta-1,3,5(10)-triene-9,17-dione monooxygenase